MRLGDLAADTSGSTQITKTMAGFAIAATAFSGSRWLSGDQEVRYRGDKFTSREASDDMKSALHRQTQLTLLALQMALLVHDLVASGNEAPPSTPFNPTRSSVNLVLQAMERAPTNDDVQGFKAILKTSTVTDGGVTLRFPWSHVKNTPVQTTECLLSSGDHFKRKGLQLPSTTFAGGFCC